MANERRPQEENLNGTLIYGADGATYFIPDEDLAAFRISDANEREVRSDLETLRSIRGFQRAGDVAGFGTGAIDFPVTIQGRIGRRPAGSMSNADTILHVDPCALRPPEPRQGI